MSDKQLLAEIQNGAKSKTYRFYDDGAHLDYLVEIHAEGKETETLRMRADVAYYAVKADFIENPEGVPARKGWASAGGKDPLLEFLQSLKGPDHGDSLMERALSAKSESIEYDKRYAALDIARSATSIGDGEFERQASRNLHFLNTGEWPDTMG